MKAIQRFYFLWIKRSLSLDRIFLFVFLTSFGFLISGPLQPFSCKNLSDPAAWLGVLVFVAVALPLGGAALQKSQANLPLAIVPKQRASLYLSGVIFSYFIYLPLLFLASLSIWVNSSFLQCSSGDNVAIFANVSLAVVIGTFFSLIISSGSRLLFSASIILFFIVGAFVRGFASHSGSYYLTLMRTFTQRPYCRVFLAGTLLLVIGLLIRILSTRYWLRNCHRVVKRQSGIDSLSTLANFSDRVYRFPARILISKVRLTKKSSVVIRMFCGSCILNLGQFIVAGLFLTLYVGLPLSLINHYSGAGQIPSKDLLELRADAAGTVFVRLQFVGILYCLAVAHQNYLVPHLLGRNTRGLFRATYEICYLLLAPLIIGLPFLAYDLFTINGPLTGILADFAYFFLKAVNMIAMISLLALIFRFFAQTISDRWDNYGSRTIPYLAGTMALLILCATEVLNMSDYRAYTCTLIYLLIVFPVYRIIYARCDIG